MPAILVPLTSHVPILPVRRPADDQLLGLVNVTARQSDALAEYAAALRRMEARVAELERQIAAIRAEAGQP